MAKAATNGNKQAEIAPEDAREPLSGPSIETRVMAVIGAIGKMKPDATHPIGKFKYVSFDAIVGHIRPLCLDHGIVLTHNVTSYNRETLRRVMKDGEEKLAFLVEIGMTLSLSNIDNPNEYIVCGPMYGHGYDTLDKAAAKAQTDARKALYRATFQLETGEETEQENRVQTPEVSQKKRIWWNITKAIENTPFDEFDVRNFLKANGYKTVNDMSIDALTKLQRSVEMGHFEPDMDGTFLQGVAGEPNAIKQDAMTGELLNA